MSKINYSGGWKLDISNYSKEQWHSLVLILKGLGVKAHDEGYTDEWGYFAVSCIDGKDKLNRWGRGHSYTTSWEIVGVLGMVERLTTPEKSDQEIKIEKLQATIDDAAKQILELKKVQK